LADDRATLTDLADLEQKVSARHALTPAEAQRVAACPDLTAVGQLAELARRARHGNRVTFVRVHEIGNGDESATGPGEAGEIRLTGTVGTADAARERVRQAARLAPGMPVTGFSLAALLESCGGDHQALAELAGALKREGLESLAEVPIDLFGSDDDLAQAIAAVRRGGLEAWRATIHHAAFPDRLPLIDRVCAAQRRTGVFRAFSPLSQVDPVDQPSTGYDDVRTVAIARLVCADIPSIQVDWRLYGPKLAQVAIAYGADDVDRVAAADAADLGPRRSAREDILRQIRMAGGEPAERDGRYDIRVV
jgi:aminodeoxyfutalosine synthase